MEIKYKFKISKRKISRSVLYLILFILGVLMMVPFFWLIFGALKSAQEIRLIPPTILPKQPTLENFSRLFSEDKLKLALYYWNSLKISLSVVFLQLVTSAFAGYVFAKFKFPGKNIVFWFIMSTMIVPTQVTMIPSYLMLSKLGLVNTHLGLIIPAAVGAFGIFLMQQFMLGIPDAYLESARMEGAKELTIFTRVVVPLSGPALATTGMMTFIWQWNAYLWPMIILKSDKLRTLPIILFWFSTQHAQKLEMISAASVLIVLPIIIVFIGIQKWIIQGMTMSGLKG